MIPLRGLSSQETPESRVFTRLKIHHHISYNSALYGKREFSSWSLTVVNKVLVSRLHAIAQLQLIVNASSGLQITSSWLKKIKISVFFL